MKFRVAVLMFDDEFRCNESSLRVCGDRGDMCDFLLLLMLLLLFLSCCCDLFSFRDPSCDCVGRSSIWFVNAVESVVWLRPFEFECVDVACVGVLLGLFFFNVSSDGDEVFFQLGSKMVLVD